MAMRVKLIFKMLKGIAIVIGGQLFEWNEGFQGGFCIFLFCSLFISSGYFCLCLCLSEMTSILPFPGGAYGFARVTLGPFIGYLIGCCESIEFILYVTVSLDIFGKMMSQIIRFPEKYEPVCWVLFYLTALTTQIKGGTVFWNFTNMIGIISLLLILTYFFASIKLVDINKYPIHEDIASRSASDNIVQFLTHLPVATWFYVGIECLPLACNDTNKPVTSVPRGMMMGWFTLFCTMIGILFFTATQAPGVQVLGHEPYPLIFGYQRVFGISARHATILLIPATFATCYGFIFSYGRQMNAMAKSGLFPKFLSYTYGPHKTPYMALIAGSLLGFVVLIAGSHSHYNFVKTLFNICILGSFFVYISMFLSFIIFRQKYTTLKRNFTNHLGIYSAYFGIFVFTVAFIAVAGFQPDKHYAVIGFVALLLIFLVYYVLVANKRQFFSPEEQAILLVAYIIKSNAKNRKSITRRETSSFHSSNGTNAGNNDNNNVGSGSSKDNNSDNSISILSFMGSIRSSRSNRSITGGMTPSGRNKYVNVDFNGHKYKFKKKNKNNNSSTNESNNNSNDNNSNNSNNTTSKVNSNSVRERKIIDIEAQTSSDTLLQQTNYNNNDMVMPWSNVNNNIMNSNSRNNSKDDLKFDDNNYSSSKIRKSYINIKNDCSPSSSNNSNINNNVSIRSKNNSYNDLTMVEDIENQNFGRDNDNDDNTGFTHTTELFQRTTSSVDNILTTGNNNYINNNSNVYDKTKFDEEDDDNNNMNSNNNNNLVMKPASKAIGHRISLFNNLTNNNTNNSNSSNNQNNNNDDNNATTTTRKFSVINMIRKKSTVNRATQRFSLLGSMHGNSGNKIVPTIEEERSEDFEENTTMIVDQMLREVGGVVTSDEIMNLIANSQETDEVKYIAKRFHEQQLLQQQQQQQQQQNHHQQQEQTVSTPAMSENQGSLRIYSNNNSDSHNSNSGNSVNNNSNQQSLLQPPQWQQQQQRQEQDRYHTVVEEFE